MRIWHSELHLLTGAYAVDALESAEFDAFERHLTRCGPCATETRGLRETAARLAIGVTLPPPPAMRQRVMDATYQTRQLPPAASQVPHGQHVQPSQRVLAGRLGRSVRPGRSVRLGLLGRSGRPGGAGRPRQPQRAGRLGRPRLGVAVAASLAAISLVAVIVLGAAQVRTTHQLDTARAVAAVLAAPDARTGSRPAYGGGTVTVIVSQARHSAVITTAGLPSLPSDEIYQLWVLDQAGARSAGLLPAAQHGRTAPLLATGVGADDHFGITVEPAGGTTRPTTTPLVVMPFPT